MSLLLWCGQKAAAAQSRGVVEVETVECDFFAAGWRDGPAGAAVARWGETSPPPPLGFAAMGLPESSLLTYLAWTDAMQRLSPSPLRGMRWAGGNIV